MGAAFQPPHIYEAIEVDDSCESILCDDYDSGD